MIVYGAGGCTVDLHSVRCFVAAAESPTFRAAARKVHLSPGAFSERLRALERELGAALFHRSSRHRRLSDAGERLLPVARQLLSDADRCRDVVEGLGGPAPWELTLGTRYELGLSWLCPALDTLSARHPERTVHLYMADTPDLMTRVERGDLDAVVFSARLTSPRVHYAPLHREEYVFVGPPGTELRGPEEVAALTLVDVSPDLPLFRYLRDALPDPTPWRFARHSYMGGIGAIRARVEAGAGVAVLPTYFVHRSIAEGRLARLLPNVELRHDAFRLVWWRGHPKEDRMWELAEELRALPLQ